ncbi:Dipeptidyl peptidase 3 [Fusarium oxysporum f. sp. cepae]|uniref:Dipeptidyl peptidase 3 n=1 Tax=Fusarium oxysporum f. sp. cepae TaxID=396571 RepID=A0A3L6NJF5_FUSOX|nr:Dipeptidyl peptidase 3 [Fusarium oxysporum f. sp. cepae]RKK62228.1 Dipeptidyl peptidase 3 [Fusarium oxysporum f. sp. cepae]RKK64522.1 Dipeptidyl peptidase 3 [Fusarium oxysporum f. sp. cepae]
MAVDQVQVFKLDIESQFGRLTDREKRYAHHMARSAWFGTRIILRQVSPESPAIFDFILELYRTCSGNWRSLIGPNVSSKDLQRLLTYAATFLSNVGNYYGSGDQKFIPGVDSIVLQTLATRSPILTDLYEEICGHINAIPPFSLGYPSQTAQSSYYPGDYINESDITMVSKVLERNSFFPENTRLRKASDDTGFEVLLASVEGGEVAQFPLPNGKGSVRLVRGDHSSELQQVCAELTEASKYTANNLQRQFLGAYIESFQSGSLDTYRNSQRIWVRDKAPRVENIFGFVEPYRDPHGIRAEFEALVAIADDKETGLLAKLVEHSATFIRRLPWTTTENDGKGPFEKTLFEPPDFSSIHTLAYCSSIIFPGINLPNYNDIRQEDGFKNVIIANRMVAESQAEQYPFIDASEAEQFKKHKYPAYYWWVVLHELLGHGTGKMMVEAIDGKFNFDIKNPPINPITGKPITCWYKPGQTWTGEFGDLATTVDECRAELVGAYLMDDLELLEMFGFTEISDIRAEDLTYNLYQQLGVDGLRGLSNFNVHSGKWGQAHSRAHFAILKCLLLDGDGVITVAHNKPKKCLKVQVDRSKIRTHGKPALGKMLLHLHMFRCTADAEGCRTYYEELSRVDEEYVGWRETVLANKPPPLIFVHANTFLDEDTVTLQEYEPTIEGVIKSWAERKV